MIKLRIILMLLLILWACSRASAQTPAEDTIEVETEGSFVMPSQGSDKLAKSVALFEAKYKAVESAGRYLSGKHMILDYQLRKEEIYSLAASRIHFIILTETKAPFENKLIYRIRIRAKIQVTDYIEADILDKQMEIKEMQEPLKEELEPEISNKTDPGLDISKAYRLLRKEQLRPAMIYLDRLQKKYPGWGAINMAKAMGFYLLDEPFNMKKELESACRLRNENACDDLKSLKRVRQFDLGN